MATLKVRTTSGAEAGTVELDDAYFGIEPNVPVMHQVVTAQLAARRAGTQSTKTRAEVAGGGAKPWKQKGTGRARQGSIRAPHWRGGGVALGPKPRDYRQRTPKKMIRLALRSALSDRAAEGKVVVVEEWGFSTPRTKDAVAALRALGTEGRVLIVLDPSDDVTWKSFRNLSEVHLLDAGQLNTFDVLCSDYVIFTPGTLPTAADEAPKAPKSAPAPKAAVPVKKAAAKAPAPKAPESDAAPAPEAEAVDEAGDDMASDLPNRPKPDPSQKRGPVDPRDRVKSVGEQVDPRFEAAKQKADKEDRLRAKQAEARSEEPEVVDEAPADEAPVAPSGGFTFNQPAQEDAS